MCVFFVPKQANAARSFGARVYCVGVKDFDANQVCIFHVLYKLTRYERTFHVQHRVTLPEPPPVVLLLQYAIIVLTS